MVYYDGVNLVIASTIGAFYSSYALKVFSLILFGGTSFGSFVVNHCETYLALSSY